MKLNIRGKVYEVSNFANIHPGGKQILQLCENEPDCTALFESYHAFCDMEYIERIMKWYDTGATPNQMFNFYEDGFYNQTKKKVKSAIHERYGSKIMDRKNSKADMSWVRLVLMMSIIFIMSQYKMFTHTNLLEGVAYSIISGVSLVCLGYNVLHDGSHYAISTITWVNQISSEIMQTMFAWNHILWSYHHCIRHHQYTGMIEYDPDLRYNYPVFRKSSLLKLTKFAWTESYLKLKLIYYHCIFPGMLVGQSVAYFIWQNKKTLWKMRLPELQNNKKFLRWGLSGILPLAHLVYGSWVCVIVYLITLNVMYFIGIAPDHDTYETHTEMNKLNKNTDWGEIQVKCASNFCTKNTLFTRLFGGINYQIEHHLFPTLSNNKLKDIAPVVQEMCKKYNIPYNCIDNPIDVFNSIVYMYFSVIRELDAPSHE